MKVTDKIEITNEDNMVLMARYPDKYFDLAIVDPPYGINIAKWDIIDLKPSKKYFKELFRVSKNQIVWGGNYFSLPPKRGWICWNKVYKKVSFLGVKECDNFELAWTSFDIKATIVNFTDIGYWYGFDGNLKRIPNFTGKNHPTQKHIALYKWLLDKYAKQGDKILDTHLGSGSIAIACHDYGFELTACELDKEYFNKAIERIKNHVSQQKLFL